MNTALQFSGNISRVVHVEYTSHSDVSWWSLVAGVWLSYGSFNLLQITIESCHSQVASKAVGLMFDLAL